MSETGTEQDRTTLPSTCTLQAPHAEIPQPNLVPVRPSSSRSAQSKGVSGSPANVTLFPFTCAAIAIALFSSLSIPLFNTQPIIVSFTTLLVKITEVPILPSQSAIGVADHRNIIEKALEWQESRLAIATVIETWRSAPCPVGTHMLIHEDGRFTGSVSGGCVEGDVLETAAAIIAGAPHELKRYGVADGMAWEVGLPCGGDIVVLIQRVDDTGFPATLFNAISDAQAAGRTLTISTDIEATTSTMGNGGFCNVYAPPRRLIIVGAVEIARTLADIARDTGFGVTVIDPRARFLTSERFPSATLDDRWPDEAIAALRPDDRTAIVTLSHDTKIDDPALIAALSAPTAYIAALGSRSSHAARLDRLKAHGFSDAQLARIEGPAGIVINAISAPEIALSIAAGMVRTFNHGLR